MGADLRLSTSKTVQVGWTVILLYTLLAELFIALTAGSPTATRAVFDMLLGSIPLLYLVYLGGPYAAAFLAKLSTSSKYAEDPSFKPKSLDASIRLADLFLDDDKNVDIYDLQYILFNVVAMLSVVILFVQAPGHSLPPVPDFLAILTGGSVATYTVNKLSAPVPPANLTVSPSSVHAGELVTVIGSNLPTTGLSISVVGPAGQQIANLGPGGNDKKVTFYAPGPPEGTVWSGALDVLIGPAGGAQTKASGALRACDELI